MPSEPVLTDEGEQWLLGQIADADETKDLVWVQLAGITDDTEWIKVPRQYINLEGRVVCEACQTVHDLPRSVAAHAFECSHCGEVFDLPE